MCGSFNITQIQGFRISILFRCNTCIVILQRRESVDYDRMQDLASVRGIIKDRRSARRGIYDVKAPITTERGIS